MDLIEEYCPFSFVDVVPFGNRLDIPAAIGLVEGNEDRVKEIFKLTDASASSGNVDSKKFKEQLGLAKILAERQVELVKKIQLHDLSGRRGQIIGIEPSSASSSSDANIYSMLAAVCPRTAKRVNKQNRKLRELLGPGLYKSSTTHPVPPPSNPHHTSPAHEMADFGHFNHCPEISHLLHQQEFTLSAQCSPLIHHQTHIGTQTSREYYYPWTYLGEVCHQDTQTIPFE